MLKMSIRPQWLLTTDEGTRRPLPQLLELLAAIHEERNLGAAARKLGVSYRHAWGLIRQSGRAFGAPLLDMSRGKRAALSPLGRILLWADRRISARLAPILDSLASELEAEIERARSDSRQILRIHASHGFAIEMLRDFLLTRHIPVDLKYRGSMEALASLCGSNCELASFHLPIGELRAEMLNFYAKWLRPESQVLINVATRRQGIIIARGNPREILSVADLVQPGVRFVNRQFGSGTRMLLDLILKRQKIDATKIAGYETGELTHSAIAAYIASEMADTGFGVETAARQFGLEFIPVVSEHYFLVCLEDSLASAEVSQILGILSSKQFRAAAGGLAGIDVTDAGSVLPVREAFPGLHAPDRGAAPTGATVRKANSRLPIDRRA